MPRRRIIAFLARPHNRRGPVREYAAAGGPIVYVVGRMKNESDVAWERVGFQATFCDAGGRLIDAATEGDFPGMVLPHAEVAFKVSGSKHLPMSRYADHKVSVVEAEQARLWP
ncbi:MAG: hypothetical protein AMK73_04595 [Planctomycetes bacterium SM23_32]|nr:MAG: hypothetical protein AMK73_04595 [Planctomycetes bacterium SM23_32]